LVKQSIEFLGVINKDGVSGIMKEFQLRTWYGLLHLLNSGHEAFGGADNEHRLIEFG